MTVSTKIVIGVVLCIYLTSLINSTVHAADSDVFYCYDCNSQFSRCPGDGMVSGDSALKVEVTNCTTGQRCYTREYKKVSNETIYRGCTKAIWLTYTLPPEDGCYDFNGDLLCICTGDRCNNSPIGKKTGVALDAHLRTANGDILPPTLEPRGDSETILCNVCNSGKSAEENTNCLAHRNANWKTSWKMNCTGRCITKTNFLYPDVGVYRECSDIWYEFPMPFRPDGCYDHYGDTVCICNKNLCNTLPLGIKSQITLEYDADTGSASRPSLLPCLLILYTSLGSLLLQ